MPGLSKGLIQVYTGDGKGKTTAALGLIMRALGQGMRACVIQFLKGGSYFGELKTASELENLDFYQYGVDCQHLSLMQDGEVSCGECRHCFAINGTDADKAREAINLAKEKLSNGTYDLIVLDEINMALNNGLIGVNEVLDLLRSKPENTELVLTGRSAPQELLELADLVTEMKEIKHPYNKGMQSRKGIEY